MILPDPEILTFEQGTPEWHTARAGLITASNMRKVLSPGKGKQPSQTRLSYMYQLIAEQMLGGPYDTYQSYAMRRGHEMEPYARQDYEFLTDTPVEQVGFIRRGPVGYSPDGLVGADRSGGIEIKSMAPHILVETHLTGKIPEEHYPQLYAGMWIGELDWIDFVGYWPNLDLFVQRVYRDEAEIERISSEVDAFLEEMNTYKQQLGFQPSETPSDDEPATEAEPDLATLF